jgi:hypothetical protein
MIRFPNTLPGLLVASGLALAPLAAFAQPAPGTVGSVPSTTTGRPADATLGQSPAPDGTPGNPPGTAVGRALNSPTPGVGMAPAAPSATLPSSTASANALIMQRQRMSQVIGSNVYNERGETIGEVEDVVLRNGTQPLAIIQVGGFLGMGARYVAVPLSELGWNAERERITMTGASKDTLQTRPAFQFETTRRG